MLQLKPPVPEECGENSYVIVGLTPYEMIGSGGVTVSFTSRSRRNVYVHDRRVRLW